MEFLVRNFYKNCSIIPSYLYQTKSIFIQNASAFYFLKLIARYMCVNHEIFSVLSQYLFAPKLFHIETREKHSATSL